MAVLSLADSLCSDAVRDVSTSGIVLFHGDQPADARRSATECEQATHRRVTADSRTTYSPIKSTDGVSLNVKQRFQRTQYCQPIHLAAMAELLFCDPAVRRTA